MDGPQMVTESDRAQVKLPASNQRQQLRSQTEGEEIHYVRVTDEPPAPTNFEGRHQGREVFSRFVCSPAWGMGIKYPPVASSCATSMKPCQGKSCRGRLYPFYYRTTKIHGQWLCYDCWQHVLLERRRELDAWYGSPESEAPKYAGDAPATVRDVEMRHSFEVEPSPDGFGNVGRLKKFEVMEMELPPEDEKSLRREIQEAS